MSIAEDMTTGVCCGMCGIFLECEDCENSGIPMYCSISCAEDACSTAAQVCNHENN